jgi:hypothetical protein
MLCAITEQDLDMLRRLKNIVDLRVAKLSEVIAEPEPEIEEPVAEGTAMPAEMIEDEETPAEWHERRLREVLCAEALSRGLAPGGVIEIKLGYLIGQVYGYGTVLERSEFFNYSEWLQSHALFNGRDEGVFTFSIPDSEVQEHTESTIDVAPAVEAFLARLSTDGVSGVRRLHINQIVKELLGRKATGSELNAVKNYLNADMRFEKVGGSSYIISPIDTQTLEPVENHIDPSVDMGADSMMGDTNDRGKKAELLDLFEHPLARSIADVFLGSGPQILLKVRKLIPLLADDEEYADFKAQFGLLGSLSLRFFKKLAMRLNGM